MLFGYNPDYVLTASIGGSAGGAAFLAPTDGSDLFDGRTGQVQSMQWISGAQNTSSYIELTITITSVIDSTKRIGVVGLCNCSLPEGTKVVCESITQALITDSHGQRSVWFVPQATGGTFTIRIYNDVNGAATFPAGTVFSIGEIYVGRVMQLCTLGGSAAIRTPIDPTVVSVTSGGQHYAAQRNPSWQVSAQLGRFTTDQAKGLATSDIPDGAGRVICIQDLLMQLVTLDVFAICDTPVSPDLEGTVHGDVKYDNNFMQGNWMLARIQTPGAVVYDQRPYWSWQPSFIEAR